MNWLWPMAPAHEPIIASGVVCPSSRIVRACSNSPRKKALRRPSWARVASEAMTGKPPVTRPKVGFDPPQRHDKARLDPVFTPDRFQ